MSAARCERWDERSEPLRDVSLPQVTSLIASSVMLERDAEQKSITHASKIQGFRDEFPRFSGKTLRTRRPMWNRTAQLCGVRFRSAVQKDTPAMKPCQQNCYCPVLRIDRTRLDTESQAKGESTAYEVSQDGTLCTPWRVRKFTDGTRAAQSRLASRLQCLRHMHQQSGCESGEQSGPRSGRVVPFRKDTLREQVIAQLARLGRALEPAFDEERFRRACDDARD